MGIFVQLNALDFEFVTVLGNYKQYLSEKTLFNGNIVYLWEERENMGKKYYAAKEVKKRDFFMQG